MGEASARETSLGLDLRKGTSQPYLPLAWISLGSFPPPFDLLRKEGGDPCPRASLRPCLPPCLGGQGGGLPPKRETSHLALEEGRWRHLGTTSWHPGTTRCQRLKRLPPSEAAATLTNGGWHNKVLVPAASEAAGTFTAPRCPLPYGPPPLPADRCPPPRGTRGPLAPCAPSSPGEWRASVGG